MFFFFDRSQILDKNGVKMSVVNSNSRLMAESQQEITVLRTKHVSTDAAIDIHRADAMIAHHKRDTHNRANAKGHNTLLSLLCIIELRIISQHWFSRTHNPINRAAADLELTEIDRSLSFVPRNLKFKFIADRIE